MEKSSFEHKAEGKEGIKVLLSYSYKDGYNRVLAEHTSDELVLAQVPKDEIGGGIYFDGYVEVGDESYAYEGTLRDAQRMLDLLKILKQYKETNYLQTLEQQRQKQLDIKHRNGPTGKNDFDAYAAAGQAADELSRKIEQTKASEANLRAQLKSYKM